MFVCFTSAQHHGLVIAVPSDALASATTTIDRIQCFALWSSSTSAGVKLATMLKNSASFFFIVTFSFSLRVLSSDVESHAGFENDIRFSNFCDNSRKISAPNLPRYTLKSALEDRALRKLLKGPYRIAVLVPPALLSPGLPDSGPLLRKLQRNGHALVAPASAAADETYRAHFALAVGTQPIFTTDDAATSEVSFSAFRFVWHAAPSISAKPISGIEHAMSMSQLTCLYKRLDCDYKGSGETLWRTCILIRSAYRARNGDTLGLFSRKDMYDNGAERFNFSLSSKGAFLRRHRQRVELAYEQATRSSLHAAPTRHILCALYGISDEEVLHPRAAMRRCIRGNDKRRKQAISWVRIAFSVLGFFVGVLGILKPKRLNVITERLFQAAARLAAEGFERAENFGKHV